MKHVENDYFKPITQLFTFDITDLYTMLPQEGSLDVLTEFLLQHGYHKVKAVSMVFTWLLNLFLLISSNNWASEWAKLICGDTIVDQKQSIVSQNQNVRMVFDRHL